MVPTPGQSLAGIVVGGLTVAGLYIVRRLVDYYFPRGRMSRWASTHSVPWESPAAPEEEEG